MRKQRKNLEVLEGTKLSILLLLQTRGGGPEGDPENEDIKGPQGNP